MSANKKTKKNAGVGKGTPGPGRPPGSPNKVTATVKMEVLAALEKLGGVRYLVAQGKKNPRSFLALLARIIPTQVVGDVSYRYVARIPPPERDSQEWLNKYAPPTTQQPTKH
jgi:hypothetical protein